MILDAVKIGIFYNLHFFIGMFTGIMINIVITFIVNKK